MDVTIRTARPLRWHEELVRRLEAAGHRVAWIAGCPGPALPSAVLLLFEMEGLLYRRRSARLWGEASPRSGAEPAGSRAPAIRIDLTGQGAATGADLRVLYDGTADPNAAVAALVDGRTPWLDVASGDGVLTSGLPASEDPSAISRGLDSVLARAVDLCALAVARLAATPPVGPERSRAAGPVPAPASTLRIAAFSLRALRGKVLDRLRRRVAEGERWRVGVRKLDGPTSLDLGRVPAEGFDWLRDDGARFYADPVMFQHDGRTWVFVEEFPFATRKGIISVCEIRADGRLGDIRPVLEEPHHLSYPHLFRWRGEIWMMPESSESRDVALYRATDFPFAWRRERALIDGVALADATLFRDEARFWLFAATSDTPGASSWDALSLFHAADLDRAFVPHPLNPVLVDVRAARPAGRLIRRDGVVIRTAQDCAGGYGAGISVAEVRRLDLEGYRQEVVGQLRAPAAWKASGLHTLDVVGGYEAVDALSARAPGPRAAP